MNSFIEYQRNQKFSPAEWGLNIIEQATAGQPVTRKETLSVLKKLPDDHNGETLKGSLRKLEQDILGNCYKSEIANIESNLSAGKKHSDVSQPEIWISPSRAERMRKKQEHLRSLLKNDPLMDQRQRRRKKRGMVQPRIALFP